MAEVFHWRAQVSTSGSGQFAVNTARFGDNYAQHIPNGINNETQNWTVVIAGYSGQVQPALNFIRAHKGQSFLWTPPLDVQRHFVCREYRVNDEGGDWWTLSMQFEQSYAP